MEESHGENYRKKDEAGWEVDHGVVPSRDASPVVESGGVAQHSGHSQTKVEQGQARGELDSPVWFAQAGECEECEGGKEKQRRVAEENKEGILTSPVQGRGQSQEELGKEHQDYQLVKSHNLHLDIQSVSQSKNDKKEK